jgi:hypothetical protein
MKVAFYKGVHPDLSGVYSLTVHWWTRSIYSHCELILPDGRSASSSYMDGGVRFKVIEYDPDKWDFIDVPDYLAPAAQKWFEDHLGQKYDLLGNIHFVLSPIGDSKTKWFCSESVAAAFGFPDAYRFDPGTFAATLRGMNNSGAWNFSPQLAMA